MSAARSTASTTDIYSEGLQMPIVKIYRAGVPNEELIAIIRTNVRLPERAMGDFRAQVAAVRTGERRFLEMIAEIRPRRVLGGIAAIMDQSEAVARARVRAIPDGVYEAESFMDDDGVNIGQRIPIRVRVEVAGDRMKVDLTEVVAAGGGLLQFRRDRGPLMLPGGVQVPHLAARPADQRRPVPRARHRAAAGPRGQRREARRDAHVDDVSDDRHRHDLQGAGAGDPGAHHRRPSRRPRGRPRQRPAARRTTASTSISAA